MDSSCQYGTYTPYCVECVRSASEVRYGAEKFKSMSLLLEGIVCGSIAQYGYSLGNCVYLNCVVSALYGCTCYLESHAYSGLLVVALALFNDYLHVLQ